MKTQTCKHCLHFCQHYRLEDLWFVPVRCGHCIYPGGKSRRSEEAACEHFAAKFPDDFSGNDQIIDFLKKFIT